jgi:predicted Zn-dependent peptidase
MINISPNSKTKPGIIPFEEFKLDNGLKVVISKDDSIPSIAINVCYHVGSKNEEPDKKGYAHLFEHLMFEGSKNLKPGEYDRITTNAGGENNAYTTEDKTNYFLLLPTNQLELGLWLESDRMLQFAIPEKSLITQKNVVIEEKKQNYDNRPYGTVSLEFAPQLFKKSGYSWDTIGDIKDIERATMEDLKSFYEKFYVPDNAVLSIVGNINPDSTKTLVNNYFGEISHSTNGINYKFEEEPLSGEIKKNIYDNVQLPGIFIGYRVPKENSKERFALELLSEILSGGESSRLYRSLVYEKQLVSEAGSYVDTREFAGVFHLYAILMPGKDVSEAEENIYLILDDINSGKISESELEKAKNKIETKQYYRRQFILSKADLLAHYKTFYNDAGLINTITSRFEQIKTDDIIAAARNFLNENNRVALIYLPHERNKKF